LTALSLQVERLETAEMSVPAKALLAAVSAGLQRTQGLVSQLLSLARAQEPSTMTAVVSLSLQHILRRVVEDLMPLIEKKKIDLGVSGESDAQVMAVEMDLITLVKNLLDNAIRYTPDEGRIELSITTNESQVLLQIDDSGSGIPLEERERVFDPFYRVLGNEEMGSGLGLAIVQTIAMRMKAEVKLSDVYDRTYLSGLRVTVTFPRTITG
jgi:two-component system OmpR family sensor kinase